MLYHQTNTNQTKMNELKTVCLCGCSFLCVFFFEEIEFTAAAKSLMRVFRCTTVMQKFHASCMCTAVF